eukprot:scaffold78995_cov48-Attheya_sp.AAC.3
MTSGHRWMIISSIVDRRRTRYRDFRSGGSFDRHAIESGHTDPTQAVQNLCCCGSDLDSLHKRKPSLPSSPIATNHRLLTTFSQYSFLFRPSTIELVLETTTLATYYKYFTILTSLESVRIKTRTHQEVLHCLVEAEI